MDWTMPSFEEIKMDAEIGSYQPAEEPTFAAVRRDVPHVRTECYRRAPRDAYVSRLAPHAF